MHRPITIWQVIVKIKQRIMHRVVRWQKTCLCYFLWFKGEANEFNGISLIINYGIVLAKIMLAQTFGKVSKKLLKKHNEIVSLMGKYICEHVAHLIYNHFPRTMSCLVNFWHIFLTGIESREYRPGKNKFSFWKICNLSTDIYVRAQLDLQYLKFPVFSEMS